MSPATIAAATGHLHIWSLDIQSGMMAKFVLAVLLGFSVFSWAFIAERLRAFRRAETETDVFTRSIPEGRGPRLDLLPQAAPAGDAPRRAPHRARAVIKILTTVVRGTARPDLRLTGTGLAPVLRGTIQFDDTRISLPSGTLEVERGSVLFRESDPWRPELAPG